MNIENRLTLRTECATKKQSTQCAKRIGKFFFWFFTVAYQKKHVLLRRKRLFFLEPRLACACRTVEAMLTMVRMRVLAVLMLTMLPRRSTLTSARPSTLRHGCTFASVSKIKEKGLATWRKINYTEGAGSPQGSKVRKSNKADVTHDTE
jgi:hypothetical protein